MPNETDTADAASGIGNLAFYRMCEEFPLHNDQDEVSDKLGREPINLLALEPSSHP
jgi:hypothetical protein